MTVSWKRTRIKAPATELYLAALKNRDAARNAGDAVGELSADCMQGDALDLMRADAGIPWEPRRQPRDVDLFGSHEEWSEAA